MSPNFNKERCAFKVGVFLVRNCEQSAEAHCATCGRPGCSRHLRMVDQRWLCQACHPVHDASHSRLDDSDADFRSRVRISRSSDEVAGSNPPAFTPGGGASGGAGASGRWDDGEAGAKPAAAGESGRGSEIGAGVAGLGAALAGSSFTTEDYLAFEAVSDFDKNDKRSANYDS